MKKLWWMFVVVAAMMVSACAPSEPEMNGTIGGYLNDGDDFNVPSDEVVFRDNSFDDTIMEVFGTMSNGTEVMAQMEFNSGLVVDPREMTPGTYYFDGTGYDAPVAARGCAGSRNAWDYDAPATEVILVVRDDINIRHVDYTLEYENQNDHLSGTITFPR